MNDNKEKLQICTNCKTGRDSFLLDNKNPFCPHLEFHNGISCGKFVPMLPNSDFDDLSTDEIT